MGRFKIGILAGIISLALTFGVAQDFGPVTATMLQEAQLSLPDLPAELGQFPAMGPAVPVELQLPAIVELVNSIPGVDLIAWGASALLLGRVIMHLVEFLKIRIRQRWPGTSGTWFTILSFAVSGALTLLINAGGMLSDAMLSAIPPPLDVIAFWLIAAGVASGWYDAEHEREKQRAARA